MFPSKTIAPEKAALSASPATVFGACSLPMLSEGIATLGIVYTGLPPSVAIT